MISIIASFVGFLASVFPEILGMLRAYFLSKNSINLMDRKLELLRAGVRDVGNISSLDDIYRSQSENSLGCTCGGRISGLSIRSILSYGFFLIYLCVKIAQFRYTTEYIMTGVSSDIRINIERLTIMSKFIWSEQDQAFLPMIVGSYFGQRMMDNFRLINKTSRRFGFNDVLQSAHNHKDSVVGVDLKSKKRFSNKQ